MKNKNPTLFTLLKMGCTVKFPSGYKMRGDNDGYINLSHQFGKDGIRNLDRQGVSESFSDAIKFAKDA